MVGKFRVFFPTIGKNFRMFSNDWKKIFGETKETKWETTIEENKICQTIMTISDNGVRH